MTRAVVRDRCGLLSELAVVPGGTVEGGGNGY